MVEGEDGYNACTHTGAWVYQYLKHLNSEKMKLIKQNKTHTGHEKYQYRIETKYDTEQAALLSFLTESFGPASMYPLLDYFKQYGNDSWTWLNRTANKVHDRWVLIKDETVLSMVLYKFPQLTP